MYSSRTLFIVVAILIGALTRLLPHPPNFTVIGAIALFGGAYLGSRWLAVVVPVLAVFLSDLVLNNTIYAQDGQFVWMYEGAWLVYFSTALCTLLGMFMLRKVSVSNVSVSAIATALLFFAITNFAVWAGSPMYPQTIGGLAACYVAALPFLGWSMLGNLFFAGIFFGGFELAGRRFPKLAARKA
ncbi:MAG: hypothetical protein IM638_15850 [Bacteroidetes bacterium]|nr:hypothetical protein [Bacteroidota bacterium]